MKYSERIRTQSRQSMQIKINTSKIIEIHSIFMINLKYNFGNQKVQSKLKLERKDRLTESFVVFIILKQKKTLSNSDSVL